MVLKALKCPNCGGEVHLDDNMKRGFCVHCGSEIINEPSTSGKVEIDSRLTLINLLKASLDSIDCNELGRAEDLANKALDIDTGSPDAWFLKGYCILGVDSDAAIRCFEKSYDYSKEEGYQVVGKELLGRIYDADRSDGTINRRILLGPGEIIDSYYLELKPLLDMGNAAYNGLLNAFITEKGAKYVELSKEFAVSDFIKVFRIEEDKVRSVNAGDIDSIGEAVTVHLPKMVCCYTIEPSVRNDLIDDIESMCAMSNKLPTSFFGKNKTVFDLRVRSKVLNQWVRSF